MKKWLGFIASALIFVALAVSFADARLLRGSLYSTPDSTGFNGGKTQVGLNFLQIANDYVFLNAVKGMQNWSYVDNTGNPDPDELSSDGYPLPGANAFSHGGVYAVFYIPLQSERPGNYVATWDGISTLYNGVAVPVLPTATFTGSITAGVLTAGAPSGGTIQKGMTLTTIGGRIGNQLTGAPGQAGTYQVIGNTTAASQPMSVDGGSKTGTLTTGNRFVFSTAEYRLPLGFASVTQTPSNWKVFHVDDEADIEAGEIVGQKFRDAWANELGSPGVVRYLDWMPGNTTNMTTWATRKPTSYVSYAMWEYRLSMWGGNTTNVGDAYTAPITPTGWTGLVDKATVIVRFNNNASGDSATLTVAGTTKPIRNQSCDPTSDGGNTRPRAGRLGTLVYDQTLDVWCKIGGDLGFGNQGLINGVPIEVMLQVATRIGAHPWIPQPYMSADPITDFMPSLATYMRDNAPSWMIPRYEGVNELWNSASGFYGTRYAWNKALAYWGGAFDHHEWYGKAMSLLGQAISAVYSDNRSRYWVVAGVQTATACNNADCSSVGTSTSNARLTSAKWISLGPNQTGYTRAVGAGEAYRWVTHVALANYINPDGYRALQELRDGYAYVVTNAGNPAAQDALADAYANGLGGNARTLMLNRATRWHQWANSNWGGSINLGLTAYEGGYSPDYSNTVWTSPVSGATVASSSVLSLVTTANPGSSNITGNPAVSGMQLSFGSARINGITQANPAVVTVNGSNLARVGQTLVISGIGSGSMTQANGSWPITGVSGLNITLSLDSSGFTAWSSSSPGSAAISGNFNITGVSGDNVTTDLNGSSFSAWPSATVTLSIASPGVVNWTSHARSVCDRVMISTTGTNPSGLSSPNALMYVSSVVNANSFNVASSCGGASVNFTGSQSGTVTASAADWTASYINSPLYTNTLRWASKFSPNLQTQTTNSLSDLASLPVLFPSHFFLSGPSVNQDNLLSGGVIGAGQVWGLYDPTIYSTPHSPAVEAIKAFNLAP